MKMKEDLTEFKRFKKSHSKEKEGTTAIIMDDGIDGECLNVDDDKKRAKDPLQDE